MSTVPISGPPQTGEPGPRAGRAPRVVALIEVILVSGFPTQLALGVALAALGLLPRDASGVISMRYLVALLLLDTALITGLVCAALQARGERPARIFLGWRAPLREIRLGAALIPVVFLAVAGVLAALRWIWPALHNVASNPFEAIIRTPADAAIVAAVAIAGGGFKEELQRAFILHRFDQHLGGARIGLVLYSLLFGAGHVLQGWDVGIITALLGLAWGLLFLSRRSVLAPMVSHSGFNAAQIAQFVLFGS